ncbi:MAG: pyridoxal-phosphate dependent enzyme [Pseudomonadota bacterium]
MNIVENPFRGAGIQSPVLDAVPAPSTDAARPANLVSQCPRAAQTPLVSSQDLAERAGVGAVFVKDERGRMALGSFKALGAAYVIARAAEVRTAAGRTYVTASAGNHGLSVAAGAAAFGAHAVIYIAETVPEAFAMRLREQGAEVVREGAAYEDSMAAAATAAKDNGWELLSDSSWPGYVEPPLILMEGYLVLMDEAIRQMQDQAGKAPTHILLQAGVGGLAGACAALARAVWGDAPSIIVVEPEFAPALAGSISAGQPVDTAGPVSSMGRLDCKEPSLIALKGLSRDADVFVTITEDEARLGTEICADIGLESTPSGTAGVSALLAAGTLRDELGLTNSSCVLAILSEGPEM